MIDIENEIYTEVRNLVKESHPKCSVSGTTIAMPAEFPFVSVDETNNYAYKRSADGATSENHAIVTYTIQVWSKDSTDRKSEAKAISNLIDNYFNKKGFVRKSHKGFNGEDGNTYRLATRYEGVVGLDNKIYRR